VLKYQNVIKVEEKKVKKFKVMVVEEKKAKKVMVVEE